jgi:hypothetical protein
MGLRVSEKNSFSRICEILERSGLLNFAGNELKPDTRIRGVVEGAVELERVNCGEWRNAYDQGERGEESIFV